LVAGQSNAANHVSSFDYENNLHVNCFDLQCFPLRNPVLGATGSGSSVVPAIASKLTSKTPYIFLTAAPGVEQVSNNGVGIIVN